MFSEDCYWDVPQHIQALNEAVFHNDIRTNKYSTNIVTVKATAQGQYKKLNKSEKVVGAERTCENVKPSKAKKKKKLPSAVDGVAMMDKKPVIKKKKKLPAFDGVEIMDKQAVNRRNNKNLSNDEELLEITDKKSLRKLQKKKLVATDKVKIKTDNVHQTTGVKTPRREQEKDVKKILSGSDIESTIKSASSLNHNPGSKRKFESSNFEETRNNKKKKQELLNSPVDSTEVKKQFDVSRLKCHLNKAKQNELCLTNVRDNNVIESNGIQQQTTSDNNISLNGRMLTQLSAARFRFINEQLYNCSGQEAAEIFSNDKESFTVYHSGFQSQVTKWPVNPVDKMIEYIRRCEKTKVVADFGCGDAKIARSVQNVVHSFDLVAMNSHVTSCDMSHVPLRSSSVDIAVFCLSLMGTTLVQYLCEANRVLKLGSTLLIAEVISRFEKIGKFVKKLQKLGFELVNKDLDNKMFVWFEFKKTTCLPSADQLPDIALLPCIYKKR